MPYCQQRSEKIIDWVSKSSDIKTVALSLYGSYFLTTSFAADHIKMKRGPRNLTISSSVFFGKSKEEYFYYGLNKAITILENSGKKVVLMIDVPELPFFPRDCFRNPHKKMCQLTIIDVDSRQSEQRSPIGKLQQNHPALSVFDPIKLFCNQNLCEFQDGEKILYRDSHHLTNRGSIIYGQYFIDWLNARGWSSPQRVIRRSCLHSAHCGSAECFKDCATTALMLCHPEQKIHV